MTIVRKHRARRLIAELAQQIPGFATGGRKIRVDPRDPPRAHVLAASMASSITVVTYTTGEERLPNRDPLAVYRG